MVKKCGIYTLLGAPNAGKSTLLNRLVGQKLAIVTPKAQTTRHRITGIALEGDAQLIFADVPGVFDPGKRKFERAMVDAAWKSAADSDGILLLVDAQKGITEEVQAILTRLAEKRLAPVLVLNKIDAIQKEKLLALTQQLNEALPFAETFMISALKGDGVADLKTYLAAQAPEGVWLFPEEDVTDMPDRLLAAEITREQCFFQLREELPYSLMIETEKWEAREDGSIAIHQALFVERESQKGIVLGKGGAQLKAIGAKSRAELERLFECRVHLFLFVKVREHWKEAREIYRTLGLE